MPRTISMLVADDSSVAQNILTEAAHDEPSFDIAIEGSTIRLAHKSSGHIFEYLWSHRPPYLRNAVIRAAAACDIAPTQVAPAAARTALSQLQSARLLTVQ